MSSLCSHAVAMDSGRQEKALGSPFLPQRRQVRY